MKMKRLVSVLLAGAMTLSLVACGASTEPAATEPAAVEEPAPAAAPAASAPAAAPAGGKPVNAPVAGTLLKYAVAEGASVSADTTVMIIESMKMELEIKAGAAGKVHFIAATGSQVTAGQAVASVQ